MQGIIVAYDSGVKAGVIKGPDNKAYYFTIDDWVASVEPAEDQVVVFKAGPWRAFEVNTVTACSPVSPAEDRHA